ncbi:methyl-accepting chemotaxis protein [bacterium]|nr:methyl-accepting chemotaxis protein [bacterium]
MKPLYQRRKPRLIVERDFQLRFTLKICILNGLLFAVFVGIFLFFTGINYEMLIDGALQIFAGSGSSPVAELERQHNLIVSLAVGSLVFLMMVLFVAGMYLSQQVAGPLVSLKSRLREFADGRPRVRMHLRKGDEFKNLEDIFNFAMECHEQRREDFKSLIGEIQELLNAGDNSKVARKISELNSKLS